jgi:hypothetical protein
MKKIIGILFIIVGLWMLIAGIVAVTNATTISNTPGVRFFGTIDQSYQNDIELQQIIGIAFTVVGLAFTIIGIVLVSKKSTKSRLESLQNIKSSVPPVFNPTKSTSEPAVINNDKYEIIEKLAKLKDQGVLTEEEFLEEKRKILTHQ